MKFIRLRGSVSISVQRRKVVPITQTHQSTQEPHERLNGKKITAGSQCRLPLKDKSKPVSKSMGLLCPECRLMVLHILLFILHHPKNLFKGCV